MPKILAFILTLIIVISLLCGIILLARSCDARAFAEGCDCGGDWVLLDIENGWYYHQCDKCGKVVPFLVN